MYLFEVFPMTYDKYIINDVDIFQYNCIFFSSYNNCFCPFTKIIICIDNYLSRNNSRFYFRIFAKLKWCSKFSIRIYPSLGKRESPSANVVGLVDNDRVEYYKFQYRLVSHSCYFHSIRY
jgi:hypothetical protein